MKEALEQIELLTTVDAGMESIQTDINLIEQFLTHANGCGLESLDGPAGSLIEIGLAARYPTHFETGGGLEGLKELVGTLKKGLEGLKKRFKGKLPPQLSAATKDLEGEIKKTYGNASWFSDKDETGRAVDTSALAKLVGDIKSGADVVNVVSTAFKNYENAIATNLKEVNAYIPKTKAALAQAKKIGSNGEELTKFANEQTAIFKPLYEKLDYIEASPKAGTGIELKLTKAQCIEIGKEMAHLPGWLRGELSKSDSAYDNALGEADLDSIEDWADNDAMHRLFWNYWSWEGVLGTQEQLCAEAGRLMRATVIEMEKLIIGTLK